MEDNIANMSLAVDSLIKKDIRDKSTPEESPIHLEKSTSEFDKLTQHMQELLSIAVNEEETEMETETEIEPENKQQMKVGLKPKMRRRAKIPDGKILVDKQKLIECMTCNVCRDVLFTPVTLMCQHTFCKKCLKSMTDKKCPACRQPFVIPVEHSRVFMDILETTMPDEYARLQQVEELHVYAITEREKIRDELTRTLYNEIAGAQIETMQFIHNDMGFRAANVGARIGDNMGFIGERLVPTGLRLANIGVITPIQNLNLQQQNMNDLVNQIDEPADALDQVVGVPITTTTPMTTHTSENTFIRIFLFIVAFSRACFNSCMGAIKRFHRGMYESLDNIYSSPNYVGHVFMTPRMMLYIILITTKLSFVSTMFYSLIIFINMMFYANTFTGAIINMAALATSSIVILLFASVYINYKHASMHST